MSLVVMKIEECFESNSLFADSLNNMNEFDSVIKEIGKKLFGDEAEVRKRQEGKDVRVVARIKQIQGKGNLQQVKGKFEREIIIAETLMGDHHFDVMTDSEWEKEVRLLENWLKSIEERKESGEDCKEYIT